MSAAFLSTFCTLFLRTSILFVFLLSASGHAQEKQERELRIDASGVPQPALDFIAQVPGKKSFRWYKEKDGDVVSFEAKGRWKRHKVSIEFNDAGLVEDIEVTQKMRSIPQTARDRITAVLKEDGSRYKIKKMQHQFVGKPLVLLAILHEDTTQQQAPNYELVVQIKVDNTYQIYEYQFDNSGKLLQRLEIIERNSFNIQF